MRKTQVALAALALVASTAALADGVTVYGTADMAIHNDSTGTYMLGSGNNAGSIFGFTGSEDLGGGLKAAFALETGVNYSTGAANANGGMGTMFNRQANVSLGDDTWNIKAGLQISEFVNASLTGLAGVTGNSGFVPALGRISGSIGGFGGGSGQDTSSTNAFFYPDLVTASVNLNGVKITAQTQVGGKTAAGASTGKYSSGSITTSVGGANLAAAIMSDETAAGVKGSVYTVGGNAQVAGVTLRGAYGSGSSDRFDGSGYALGFDYSLSDALAIGYTFAKSSWNTAPVVAASASSIGAFNLAGTQNTIGAKYSLSKRTFTYLTHSNFGEASTMNAGNWPGGSVKSITTLGVAHSF